MQLTLFGAAEHPFLDQIRELDLNQLTPLDALTKLSAWQDELRRASPKKQAGQAPGG